MQYLERVAEEIAEFDDIVTGKRLVQLIRDITYPISGSPRDNSRTWHSCAKVISALPSSAVTVDDLGMLSVWLSSGFDTSLLGHELGRRLLPKLLASNSPEDREGAIVVLQATSRLRWVKRDETEQSQGDPVPLISQHAFEELLKHNATALGKRCGRESAEVLLGLLQDVLGTPDTDEYTYVWRPAIEEHPQNTRYHDAREALVSGTRDLLLAFATVDPPEAQELLQELWIRVT
jgi:hypothetical protein